jgi:hypothetical protein
MSFREERSARFTRSSGEKTTLWNRLEPMTPTWSHGPRAGKDPHPSPLPGERRQTGLRRWGGPTFSLEQQPDREPGVERGEGSRLPRGLGAGVLGTLALTGWEPLRDCLLDHPPPYAVESIARRGAQRWLDVRLGRRESQRWGLVMRWMYGPALGALYAWLRPSLAPTARLRGLTLGCGVWLCERLVFPRLHVTPPPRTWSSSERWLLVLQTSLFGLVTEAVLSRWQASGQGSGRSPTGCGGDDPQDP